MVALDFGGHGGLGETCADALATSRDRVAGAACLMEPSGSLR